MVRKLKASSLVETLVATVIIVILFSIASLTLNNIFKSAIKNNTDRIDTQLTFLHYQLINQQINIPYSDMFNDWEITIRKTIEFQDEYILFEAIHAKHKKTVSKKIINAAK